MLYELETGDVFRAAYLVSRGARVIRSTVQGGDHVSLTLTGEDLDHEDHRYRTAAGMVEPLRLKENLNRLRDLIKKILRNQENPDRRTYAHSRIQDPIR